MKICMLLSKFPPVPGGPGSIALEISKHLIKRGDKVFVVTQKFGDLKEHENLNGIEIFRVETPFSKGNYKLLDYIKSIFKLSLLCEKVIEKNNITTIHVHDISFGGLAGLILKYKLPKLEFILKYGGDLVYEFLSLKKIGRWDPSLGVEKSWELKHPLSKIVFLIQKILLKKYDVIYADSEYGHNLLTNKLGIKNVKTIKNAINHKKFSPRVKNNIKKELNIKNKKMIFTASRLVPWKGIEVVIKALPIVLKKFPNVVFVVGGIGDDKQRLIKIAKKEKCRDSLTFVGSIKRNEMPKYLNACDIFSLTSYYDTTPNSLLEAMSCGKPCIVSNIDGIKEVISDKTVVSVNVNDYKSVSNAICKVLSNKKLAKNLGKRARDFITKNYDSKKMFKNILELYAQHI